jgi:hypothetical protein
MSKSFRSVLCKLSVVSAVFVCAGFNLSGNAMNLTKQPKSPVDEYVKAVASDTTSAILDANVTKYLRSQYKIKSATYYKVDPVLSWQQVVKPVQNEMAEKFVPRVSYDWHSPGIDLIEVFPQGKSAFAVAMLVSEKKGAPHLIGYYVLEK